MDFKQRKFSAPCLSLPWYINASIASAAGLITEALVFPLENLRLRMQVNGKYGYPIYNSLRDCIRQTFAKGGLTSLERGLSITLLREFAFIAPKIYAFEQVKRYFAADVERVGYYRKLCPLVAASAFGLMTCNMLDIIRIKYITDVAARPKRSIKSIFQNLTKMENTAVAFRGYGLNFIRTSLFISAELAGYQQTKLLITKKLRWHKDSSALHVVSSVAASIAACVASCPFDVIRTRFMSQLFENKTHLSGTQCALDIIRNDGLKTFYRGLVPFVLKTIPSSLLFFTLAENLKMNYLKSIDM